MPVWNLMFHYWSGTCPYCKTPFRVHAERIWQVAMIMMLVWIGCIGLTILTGHLWIVVVAMAVVILAVNLYAYVCVDLVYYWE